MRVAIVTTSGIDPLYRNWPEYALARGLVARGHEVAIHRYEPAGSPPCATIDGIRVHTARAGPLGSPDLRRQLARAPRPDVVHLWHIRNLLAYEGARYARRRGVPLVHTPNGPLHDDYLVADRDRPFEGRLRYDRLAFTVPDLLRRLAAERRPRHALRNYRIHAPLRAADRLIAISEHEARALRHYGRLPAARIVTIPQWIDVAYQDALPQEPAALDLPRPILLYVGQLKYRKGFDVLAAAMPLVLRDHSTASFVFVGHSPLHRDALEASARASGVADHLHLLGRPDAAELNRLYRAADALILPTRYEGFGLPPLEAMAAGCPVVTTDVPAVNELVRDGENGLLARYGDPASLAATIGRLLADPALRACLVAAGRETVTARYDGDRLVARIEAVYRECVASGVRRSR